MQNNIIKYFLLVIAFLAIFSCEKKDEKVMFREGTNPVLTSTTADQLILNKDMPAKAALSLSWTNPNYTFNTGINSQNVTYQVQVDTAGSNFNNPKMQQYSVSNNLKDTLTNVRLNTMLLALGLDFNKPYDIEFRVKSVLGLSAVPLFSNVITKKITPYADYPDLWIVGDATPESWTNTPSDKQKFSWDAATKTLVITMAFVSGKYYKFLSKHGQWQPQYGGTPATGGTLLENPGDGNDPDGIPTPTQSGNYRLNVDLGAKTLTVTKV